MWYKAGVNSWVLGTLLSLQAGSWSVALDSEAGEGTGPVHPAAHTHACIAHCRACMSALAAQTGRQGEGNRNAPSCCLQVVTCKPEQLVPANPVILDGIADLTGLTYLNEPSILHGLNLRYAEGPHLHARRPRAYRHQPLQAGARAVPPCYLLRFISRSIAGVRGMHGQVCCAPQIKDLTGKRPHFELRCRCTRRRSWRRT